jgi:DNA-binding response OmpR family regulator
MGRVLVATADGGYFDIVDAEIAAEGHQSIWSTDGQDAQDLALSEQPDLVILDATLPVFSGLEVATALRGDPEVPSGLPIVVVGDEAIHPHLLEQAGVTFHARKTHSRHEMRDLLVECLQGYRNH